MKSGSCLARTVKALGLTKTPNSSNFRHHAGSGGRIDDPVGMALLAGRGRGTCPELEVAPDLCLDRAVTPENDDGDLMPLVAAGPALMAPGTALASAQPLLGLLILVGAVMLLFFAVVRIVQRQQGQSGAAHTRPIRRLGGGHRHRNDAVRGRRGSVGGAGADGRLEHRARRRRSVWCRRLADDPRGQQARLGSCRNWRADVAAHSDRWRHQSHNGHADDIWVRQ